MKYLYKKSIKLLLVMILVINLLFPQSLYAASISIDFAPFQQALERLEQTLIAWLGIEPRVMGAQVSTATDVDRVVLPTLRAPQGLSDPVLAFGLSGVNDWNPGLQFIDHMKMGRPFFGFNSSWEDMTSAEMKAQGYVDEYGWVKAIPDGMRGYRTVFAWGGQPEVENDRRGVYYFMYDGEGIVRFSSRFKKISEQPGLIIIEVSNPTGNLWFDVIETDPKNTGNYIRNISLVHERHIPLYEAGAIFNPEWLSLINDARTIRFMDWQKTNSSNIVGWHERTKPNGIRTADGVAIEHMVELANLIGADPWFTMPHLADDNYIRQFALYVRNNLDPTLTARVEYSNELWNSNFSQTKWHKQQAIQKWNNDSFGATLSYAAKRATNMARIWREVYANEPAARLSLVMGSQAVNAWVSNRFLNAPEWKSAEPNAYILPASLFDELAITSYFGGQVVSNQANRDALLAAINDPTVDAEALVVGWLLDPNFGSSIPTLKQRWQEQAVAAQNNGVTLTSYEGGQHVHHLAFLRGITDEEERQLRTWLADFVRGQGMATLYAAVWEAWREVSDGPFMQFVDINYPGKWGSFGLYRSLSDSTPRSKLFEELNRTTARWWNEQFASDKYQHGYIAYATRNNETLVGSKKIDHLIGNSTDNIFYPGPGNDRVNGVGGTNRVLFSGPFSNYVITKADDGYQVDGPEGRNYLVNIHYLQFSDRIVLLTNDSTPIDDVSEHVKPADPVTNPPNEDGADSDPVVIPAFVNLTVDQAEVHTGAIINLQWITEEVTSCLAEGDWSGTRPVNGSEQVIVDGPSVFTLSCRDANGEVVKDSVSVTIREQIIEPEPPANITQRVITTENLRVRSAPGLQSRLLGVQRIGSTGTAQINTELVQDGLTWVRVEFDRGPSGFVATQYLRVVDIGANTESVEGAGSRNRIVRMLQDVRILQQTLSRFYENI